MVQLNLIGVILFLLKIFILLLLNLEKITSKSINYIAYLLKKYIYSIYYWIYPVLKNQFNCIIIINTTFINKIILTD